MRNFPLLNSIRKNIHKIKQDSQQFCLTKAKWNDRLENQIKNKKWLCQCAFKRKTLDFIRRQWIGVYVGYHLTPDEFNWVIKFDPFSILMVLTTSVLFFSRSTDRLLYCLYNSYVLMNIQSKLLQFTELKINFDLRIMNGKRKFWMKRSSVCCAMWRFAFIWPHHARPQ